MKRIAVLLLAFVMVFSFTVTSFAAANNFVGSPTVNTTPTVVKQDPIPEAPEVIVDTISYSEREKYGGESQAVFEQAYKEIVAADDLTKVAPELTQIAKEKGISKGDLAVSDFYEHVYVGTPVKDEHGLTSVYVKPEMLKNYVAMLCFANGKWVVVEDVKIVDGCLKYLAQDNVPYAIVVKTEGLSKTGEEPMNPIWIVLLAVSAVGLVTVSVVFLSSRRKKDED